jgi:hypothetical protein
VIDMSAFQMWLAVLIGWLNRQQREALALSFAKTASVFTGETSGRRSDLCTQIVLN